MALSIVGGTENKENILRVLVRYIFSSSDKKLFLMPNEIISAEVGAATLQVLIPSYATSVYVGNQAAMVGGKMPDVPRWSACSVFTCGDDIWALMKMVGGHRTEDLVLTVIVNDHSGELLCKVIDQYGDDHRIYPLNIDWSTFFTSKVNEGMVGLFPLDVIKKMDVFMFSEHPADLFRAVAFTDLGNGNTPISDINNAPVV